MSNLLDEVSTAKELIEWLKQKFKSVLTLQKNLEDRDGFL